MPEKSGPALKGEKQAGSATGYDDDLLPCWPPERTTNTEVGRETEGE